MPISDVSNFNCLTFTLDFFFGDEPAQQAAQVATPLAAVAAISPPPLNLFPPQGAPQPGSVAGGGGVTPVVALVVRKLDFDSTILYEIF